MNKGILGKKLGITQVFDTDGKAIPVTVVEAGPCTVVQKKTVETDGYNGLQLGYGDVKPDKVNKPMMGHFKKAGLEPKRYLREFRLDDITKFEIGNVIEVNIFNSGDRVDIVATSKGKGFAGVIKRWNQHRGPMAHGSKYHRRVGSMGGSSSPSRVFKGKHLPGHMGNARVTVQNLEVFKTYPDKNLMLVKGSVPGIRGSLLYIKDSIKVNK